MIALHNFALQIESTRAQGWVQGWVSQSRKLESQMTLVCMFGVFIHANVKVFK